MPVPVKGTSTITRMTKREMISFTARVTSEMAVQLRVEAKLRGITVDNLLAYYAHEGLAGAALSPDERDKLRRRHADVVDLHKRTDDGTCWECGAEHPCSTYSVLTEDPDEYELQKPMP